MSEDRPLFSSLALEGEYTDWVYQWTRDLGAVIPLATVHVDNFGTVYASTTAWNSYVIDRANNLTANLGYVFEDLVVQLVQKRGSITNKYMIDVERLAQRIFRVWRYGAVLNPNNVNAINADFDAIWHIAISPNGRYIAANIRSVATGNIRYIVLWMAE